MLTAHRAIGVFVLTVLIGACAHNPSRPTLQVPKVGFSDGVLWYEGAFAEASPLLKLFELYEQQPVPPERLRINSPGGDVALALGLGEWVQAKRLDVEIIGECASSCANYVFTAGQRKFLHPDSVLMWHGGAFQQSLEDDAQVRGPAVVKALKAWRQRELDFFERAGVNPLITTYGQLPDWAPIVSGGNYSGYDYALEHLAYFGVRNIEEIGGAWQPQELRPEARVLRITVDPELLSCRRLGPGK